MNNNTEKSNNYIDFNNKWNYPLQYMWESRSARDTYQSILYRMRLAMQGKPWKNLYQEELNSNIKKITDKALRASCEKSCIQVPAGRDFTLCKAINTRANQMASGVETYNYSVNDPYGIIDAATEDLLAAKCEQDYQLNNLENLSATFSRDLSMAGLAAVEVRYCPWSDKNKVRRIAPKNCFWDTRYSSTGEERFRGYNVMISWSCLKRMIESDPNEEINLTIEAPNSKIISDDGKLIDKTAKYSNRKIRSLNGLDIYVETINKLASSPSLARDASSYREFQHDLHDCYNTNWYSSYATDPEARTKNGYVGDDVELTVMYDMERQIEFKIINRRYVISANSKAFHRKIVYNVTNPVTGEITPRIDDFNLPCPLKFQFENEESRDIAAFPTSLAMYLLDSHDRLCALIAKRQHVADILSILRIETNGGDAESLRGLINIMGIVIDDVQGNINTLNFTYDFTPLDSEIQRLQEEIKTTLNAYSDFDALQSMGDRASAAEAGNAVGAIAQGLATHQNSIMRMYADIARQCIANRVAYSPEQEFSVVNNGEYNTLTVQQMALTAMIEVKPKMAKRVNEKAAAANALTILGSLKDLLTSEGVARFASEAMYGNVSRAQARAFIQDQQPSEAQQQTAQLEAQNMATQLEQNQQAYMDNPIPYEAEAVVNNPNNSPEDIDAIIAGLAASQGGGGAAPATEPAMTDIAASEGIIPQGLDMVSQEGAMVTNLPNQTPEMGSMMANPNSMG